MCAKPAKTRRVDYRSIGIDVGIGLHDGRLGSRLEKTGREIARSSEEKLINLILYFECI